MVIASAHNIVRYTLITILEITKGVGEGDDSMRSDDYRLGTEIQNSSCSIPSTRSKLHRKLIRKRRIGLILKNNTRRSHFSRTIEQGKKSQINEALYRETFLCNNLDGTTMANSNNSSRDQVPSASHSGSIFDDYLDITSARGSDGMLDRYLDEQHYIHSFKKKKANKKDMQECSSNSGKIWKISCLSVISELCIFTLNSLIRICVLVQAVAQFCLNQYQPGLVKVWDKPVPFIYPNMEAGFLDEEVDYNYNYKSNKEIDYWNMMEQFTIALVKVLFAAMRLLIPVIKKLYDKFKSNELYVINQTNFAYLITLSTAYLSGEGAFNVSSHNNLSSYTNSNKKGLRALTSYTLQFLGDLAFSRAPSPWCSGGTSDDYKTYKTTHSS